nr:Fic/DOC family N-terminal domain-containing protein [Thermodesulfovibrio thiophilus]
MYVKKEALLSSQIEGTQASLEGVLEFEAKDVVSKLKIRKDTANELIKSFEKIGILHEITGKQRYRKYIFKDYVDIIKRGTEL